MENCRQLQCKALKEQRKSRRRKNNGNNEKNNAKNNGDDAIGSAISSGGCGKQGADRRRQGLIDIAGISPNGFVLPFCRSAVLPTRPPTSRLFSPSCRRIAVRRTASLPPTRSALRRTQTRRSRRERRPVARLCGHPRLCGSGTKQDVDGWDGARP